MAAALERKFRAKIARRIIEVDPQERDRNNQDPEGEDVIVVDISPAARSNTKMMSSPYRAPSWSWASADGAIRQLFPDPTPNGTKGYQLCIEVAAARVVPLNLRDNLGGLTDGWLRILSCGLLKVERSWNNTIVVKFNAPESQRVVEESDAGNTGNSDLKLDTVWDWPESLGQDGDLFYLPVWLNTTPYHQRQEHSSSWRFNPRYIQYEKKVRCTVLISPTEGHVQESWLCYFGAQIQSLGHDGTDTQEACFPTGASSWPSRKEK